MNDSQPIEFIPRDRLFRWADQPRQHFSEAGMTELRGSMKEHGFLLNFPLLVRPRYGAPQPVRSDTLENLEMRVRDGFEIIAGERRWIVAGECEVEMIPCVVREMTDKDALEMALIENLQRENLNPMEEALGFARLDGMIGAERPQANDEERYAIIAAKVGRSERHVRRRLALTVLAEETAGRAIESGRMPATHGAIIAGVPSRQLREEITRQVLGSEFGKEGCMPLSKLELLMLDFKRELRGATFDQSDATLVPEAGACSGCRWNTKNQQAEPVPGGSDAASGRGTKFHACLNPECFGAKESAHHERWRGSMNGDGVSTLAYEDNAALWDYSGKNLAPTTGYVELQEQPLAHELKTGSKLPSNTSWGTLTEGRGVHVVMARDTAGKVHRLARHEEVVAATRQNGHAIFRDSAAAESGRSTASTEGGKALAEAAEKKVDELAQAAAMQREEAERVTQSQIGAVVRAVESRPKPPEGFWAALWMHGLASLPDAIANASKRRGFEKGLDLVDSVFKGTESYGAGAFIEVLLQQELIQGECPFAETMLHDLSELYQVDLKAAAKQARAQLEAEREEEANQAELATGLKWSSLRNSAEEFVFNEHGACERPDRCEVTLPKSGKMQASVSVARCEAGWVLGYFYSTPKGGGGPLPNMNETKYATRDLALRTGLLAIELEAKKLSMPEGVMKRLAAYLGLFKSEADGQKGAKGGGK